MAHSTRPLRKTALALLLAALAAIPVSCFPLLTASNGSVHLQTAFGGNLYLSPAGGA
jgi:hypothetical protein